MNIAQRYMLRAIEMGKKASGHAAPNPMVGCVIVHNGKIIGEGFTSPYGGPHAEVNAINSVKDKSLLKEATLYVTLEPCSHFGKTPPCADLIIDHEIPHVVIGLKDPHEKVAGQGIKRIRDAGCEVSVGLLESECREHHKRFLTFQEKKRPYIILKWAETADGFIAPKNNVRSGDAAPVWITNRYSRQLVHQWRTEEQAILVGTETVIKDNPRLTSRDWAGRDPVRVVLDRQLRISEKHHVFDGSVKTYVLTENTVTGPSTKNIEYLTVQFNEQLAQNSCQVCHQENISSLIVEGGSKTLQTFIDANLWDEARIFTGTVSFKTGVSAPKISGTVIDKKEIEGDSLTLMKND